MLRPSRPMIRPFMSSLGRSTTETVVSMACSAALRWMASVISCRALPAACSRASASRRLTRCAASRRASCSICRTSSARASSLVRPATRCSSSEDVGVAGFGLRRDARAQLPRWSRLRPAAGGGLRAAGSRSCSRCSRAAVRSLAARSCSAACCSDAAGRILDRRARRARPRPAARARAPCRPVRPPCVVRLGLAFGAGDDLGGLFPRVRRVGRQALAGPDHPQQDREGGHAVQHESDHFEGGPLAHGSTRLWPEPAGKGKLRIWWRNRCARLRVERRPVPPDLPTDGGRAGRWGVAAHVAIARGEGDPSAPALPCGEVVEPAEAGGTTVKAALQASSRRRHAHHAAVVIRLG